MGWILAIVAFVIAYIVYTMIINREFLRCPNCRKIGSWRFDSVGDSVDDLEWHGPVKSDYSQSGMSKSSSIIFLLVLLTACEKVPVLEAQVRGEGLAPIIEYQAPNESPKHWYIEDDWHRLFMAARASPDRLLFFIRTHDEPSASPPSVWWLEGARRMTLKVTTDCDSGVQYFDNPGNSFGNNFLKADYPEIYPHSPEGKAPGFSAIVTVEDCVGPIIDLSITVLDESGEPARRHELKVRVEQVDWYYNPLFP